MLFSDTVFILEAATTDYHVTFVEHCSINVRNATTGYVFRVTQNSVAFEIQVYFTGNDTTCRNYVCVSIKMLTNQRKPLDLVATFRIKASDSSWQWLKNTVSALLQYDSVIYELILLNKIMNKANKLLDDSGVFTIRMAGSYLIHSQHTVVTPRDEYITKAHTSVDMSYTWTVCNLTLPLVDTCRFIVSERLFDGPGLAMFYIKMYLGTEAEDLIKISCDLVYTPSYIKLPLTVRFTTELMDSNAPTHAVIAKRSTSHQYKHYGSEGSSLQQFKYNDFVKSVLQQCVSLKFRLVYEL